MIIVVLIAVLVLTLAAYYVSPIRHGIWPSGLDWRPKTLRGRFAYLGFCAIGIAILVAITRH